MVDSSSFIEAYGNPDAVFIALILLIGVITYAALNKTMLKKNRGVVVIIAAIAGLITASALYNSRDEPFMFNLFIILMVLLSTLYIIIPFIRFVIGK